MGTLGGPVATRAPDAGRLPGDPLVDPLRSPSGLMGFDQDVARSHHIQPRSTVFRSDRYRIRQHFDPVWDGFGPDRVGSEQVCIGLLGSVRPNLGRFRGGGFWPVLGPMRQ